MLLPLLVQGHVTLLAELSCPTWRVQDVIVIARCASLTRQCAGGRVKFHKISRVYRVCLDWHMERAGLASGASGWLHGLCMAEALAARHRKWTSESDSFSFSFFYLSTYIIKHHIFRFVSQTKIIYFSGYSHTPLFLRHSSQISKQNMPIIHRALSVFRALHLQGKSGLV